MSTVSDVRNFWEQNPLWTGESEHPAGSLEFFEEHRNTIIRDGFAGQLDEAILKVSNRQSKVLDVGCGPGFWVVEYANRGVTNLSACDLTVQAIELTKKRIHAYGLGDVDLRIENAEHLSYADGTFDHVNCQGVIHHTPDTKKCVEEIHRVLKTEGTASISVYYRNILLKAWPIIGKCGKLLSFLGGGLKGRGRDEIFSEQDSEEIVRLYDGSDNPIGKCYSKREFVKMLESYFHVKKVFYHFFPARALPLRVPKLFHRILDRHLPFMIYANVRKKP